MANGSVKVFLSHATGNTNVRAIVAALEKEGLLDCFMTTIAVNPLSWWLNIIPARIRTELLRRKFTLGEGRIRIRWMRETGRLLFPKLGLQHWVDQPGSWANINSVYRDLDKTAARYLTKKAGDKGIHQAYGYEDGALNTFTAAKKHGISCIYELPIAYWETLRHLLTQQAVLYPEWAVTLKGGISDSTEKLNIKTKELELADTIIVPSQFVKDSLPEFSLNKKIVVVPFGTPTVAAYTPVAKRTSAPDSSNPLKILFVGSMSQRKGLADLFKAFGLLKSLPVELVVLGSLQAPMDFYRAQYSDFRYEVLRPNERVLELMRSCDIFCLPSIVEGRALVMQEAMSQGLPLIITPNTGGADLIRGNETGFLVPINSPEVIAEKITWFLQHWEQISQMGKKAREHACSYTWENYSNTIINILKAT